MSTAPFPQVLAPVHPLTSSTHEFGLHARVPPVYPRLSQVLLPRSSPSHSSHSCIVPSGHARSHCCSSSVDGASDSISIPGVHGSVFSLILMFGITPTLFTVPTSSGLKSASYAFFPADPRPGLVTLDAPLSPVRRTMTLCMSDCPVFSRRKFSLFGAVCSMFVTSMVAAMQPSAFSAVMSDPSCKVLTKSPPQIRMTLPSATVNPMIRTVAISGDIPLFCMSIVKN